MACRATTKKDILISCLRQMKERVRETEVAGVNSDILRSFFFSLLHSIMTAEVNAANTDLKMSTRLLIYRARMMDYEQRRYLIWSSCMHRFEFAYTQLFPFCANKFSSYFGCQPQARYPIICEVSYFNWAPFRSIKQFVTILYFLLLHQVETLAICQQTINATSGCCREIVRQRELIRLNFPPRAVAARLLIIETKNQPDI